MTENRLHTASQVMLNLHEALLTNGYKPYIPVQRMLVKPLEDQGKFMPVIGQLKDDESAKPDENG